MILDRNSFTAPAEKPPPPYTDELLPRIEETINSNPLPPLPPLSPPPLPPRRIPSVTASPVYVQTRHKDITGTYNIDPWLPSAGYTISPQKPSRSPNAIFRTRHGRISLDLVLTSRKSDAAQASVIVGSRSGDINITLLDLADARRINLEVTTRRGNIALLVPRTFCGVIQLRTRRGALELLPALAMRVRVLKESENEALVMFGDSQLSQTTESGHPPVADFCQLTTRTGKVIVGLKDEDKLLPPEPGLWRKLGRYLRGSDQVKSVQ